VHTADCHSPALDSGFRRNDVSRQSISWFVMPTKVGAFRYPGFFDDCAEYLRMFFCTRHFSTQLLADKEGKGYEVGGAGSRAENEDVVRSV
jgi:hypothetical protein